MKSERDILRYIKAGKLALPPIKFNLLTSEPRIHNKRGLNIQTDVLLEAKWEKKPLMFVGEIKRYSSEKTVLEAANQAKYYAENLGGFNPLVIVPWLSEKQLLWLQDRKISAIDLCGNGVVVVPNRLLIFKSGQLNKFPASRLVRRVYEGTSSLVARVFLLRSGYTSVSEILKEIQCRGGSITLPTISKVLKQLQEDLIIEKTNSEIKLLQPEKLLDRLKEHYRNPEFKDTLRCKITLKDKNQAAAFSKMAKTAGIRLVLSGESSAASYATMAKESIAVYFCTEMPLSQFKRLGAGVDVNSLFPNLEFRVTDALPVYFDARNDKSKYKIASPIQSYLELSASDKRGQEIAEQIKMKILDRITKS